MSTILIGIDATERSDDALAFGQWLASVSSAHVIIATAFPYSDTPSGASSGPYRQWLSDDAEQTASASSDRLEGIAADRVHIRIAANPSPAHALHDLAVSEHAEIVVVGSSHTGRLGASRPAAPASACCTGRRARSRSSRTATDRGAPSRATRSASPTTAPTKRRPQSPERWSSHAPSGPNSRSSASCPRRPP